MERRMSFMRPFRSICLVLVVAATLGCTRKPPADDAHFPLDQGRTWTYAVTRADAEEGEEPLTLKVAVVGQEEVQGVRVTREKIDLGEDTHFLFVGVDEHGIFRHATQSPGDPAPAVEPERDYFLRQPLEVGRKWTSRAAPTFIEVVDVPVQIESTVVSTNETVRTPAGEFTDCVKIRVHGTAEVREEQDEDDAEVDADADDELDVDFTSGTYTVDEETWYAKDVGVVKSVMTETFTSEIDDQRATVTTELQSFTR
jgi:hypothetical protein